MKVNNIEKGAKGVRLFNDPRIRGKACLYDIQKNKGKITANEWKNPELKKAFAYGTRQGYLENSQDQAGLHKYNANTMTDDDILAMYGKKNN